MVDHHVSEFNASNNLHAGRGLGNLVGVVMRERAETKCGVVVSDLVVGEEGGEAPKGTL